MNRTAEPLEVPDRWRERQQLLAWARLAALVLKVIREFISGS